MDKKSSEIDWDGAGEQENGRCETHENLKARKEALEVYASSLEQSRDKWIKHSQILLSFMLAELVLLCIFGWIIIAQMADWI